MSSPQKYEWFFLEAPDKDVFIQTKQSIHHAIQCIAAVGRTFSESPQEEEDGNAKLYWVPGLWRMAGTWVSASKEFRGSIGLRDQKLYLVDPRLNLLDEFPMEGHSYHELMLWVEQQIIELELSSSKLSTSLPYALPPYAEDHKKNFVAESLALSEVLGGHYHNAFILFQRISASYENTSDVSIYPHHFDMEIKVTLKKTDELATDTFVRLGFSPGDNEIEIPYLYINAWPHITGETLPKAPLDSYWVDGDWYGLVLSFDQVYGKKEQQAYQYSFLEEGLSIFTHLLLG